MNLFETVKYEKVSNSYFLLFTDTENKGTINKTYE